ncbi:hypothetical protein ACFW2Y_29585 [Streptomyces sp. NPDC058877]|uniref:hypothetical protein n=1 Tax=unclassified Streptomyces TaxID=2593676 RepID=UPI0036CE8D06
MTSRRRSRPGRAAGTTPAVRAAATALTVLLTASCGATKAADGAGAEPGASRASSAEPAGTCELSGSTEQITARFSMLGKVVSTQWCAIDLTQDSGRVPGPSDIRLVGYFDITAADMKALVSRTDWTFTRAPLPLTELPAPVVQAAGATSSSTSVWVTSAELEKTVTREVYSGSFYIEEKANRIVFDTVNPVRADAKVEYY